MSDLSDATDIEKKSLEAHVELCSQRYKFLEDKITGVDQKMVALSDSLLQLKNSVLELNEKRYRQILSWGTMLISALTGSVAYLFMNYIK